MRPEAHLHAAVTHDVIGRRRSCAPGAAKKLPLEAAVQPPLVAAGGVSRGDDCRLQPGRLPRVLQRFLAIPNSIAYLMQALVLALILRDLSYSNVLTMCPSTVS